MRYLLLCIFFISRYYVIAQQPDIVFHHITEKEGLSYNIVNCFLKDSKGMLWIGTYNGLNKYDGAHFYTYHSGYGKNTLPNNCVHDLAEDMKGNIWGATDNGVFCLNPNTGNFKNYSLSSKNGMTGVHNILVAQDGIIWAANYVKLSFFNAAADTFQMAPINGKYPELWIRKNGMAESPDGKGVYLAARQGLLYYEKSKAQFIVINEKSINKLQTKNLLASALCKTPYGHYWYVDNGAKTIVGFDPNTKKIKYRISTDAITNNFEAATLFEDNNHMLWLSTWGYEIYKIDYLHGNKVTRIRHNKNDVSSVAGDFFWDAMQEADGTMWLGTVGGISKCNPSRSFYKIHQLLNPADTIENHVVNFVAENPLDKTWWIGTSNKILVNYNPITLKSINYDLNQFMPNSDKKTPSQVYRMVFLKDSILLFSHAGAWLKKGKGNFTLLSLPGPFKNWVLRDVTMYNQHILYCVAINKLLQWDLSTGKLDSFVFTKPFIVEGNGLYLGVPKADRKGKVWMLNGSNWLTYSDGKELKPIRMNYQDSTDAYYGYFTSMMMDKKGDLWMSKKGDGLIYYNPSKNASKQYKQVDGLVMDHIMAVAEDGDGKIWSACYNQFSVYNPLLKSFFNFTLPLSTNNYDYGNLMTTLQNGNIIASIGGDVVEFFPSRLNPPQIKEQPLISMLSINGQDKNVFAGLQLKLLPTENSLRIKFGMLTDIVVMPYDMLYILKGAETSWSAATENFEANYNGLPSGSYTFKVKAIAKDKSWQTNETVLYIHIATPFYKTIWFYILLIGMMIAAIVSFYRYRLLQRQKLYNLESKAQLLEKEKARVMYESLKQQLNPHFLFNSLTSLSGLIDLDQELAGSFLEQMSGIYRYILKNGDSETVTLKDELEFVKLYTSLQQTRFNRGLHIHIDIGDEFLHYKIAPVTLQNLIENAIKHNIIDTDAPLVINIFIENDYLVVKNNLQRKNMVETSNKRGLEQFETLYKYLSEKPIIIEETPEHFTIKVPLI